MSKIMQRLTQSHQGLGFKQTHKAQTKMVYPPVPVKLIYTKVWLCFSILLNLSLLLYARCEYQDIMPKKPWGQASMIANPSLPINHLLPWLRYPQIRISPFANLMHPAVETTTGSAKPSQEKAAQPTDQTNTQPNHQVGHQQAVTYVQSTQSHPAMRWRMSIIQTMVSPATLQQWWQRAVAYEQRGEPEMARLAYEDVLRMDNQHLDSLQALAKLAITRGDMNAAQAYQARIEALFPLSSSD